MSIRMRNLEALDYLKANYAHEDDEYYASAEFEEEYFLDCKQRAEDMNNEK